MVYIIGAESCASWAMIPGLEAREYLEKGLLIELKPDAPLEKDMYWHVSCALQDAIVEITASVRQAACVHIERSRNIDASLRYVKYRLVMSDI